MFAKFVLFVLTKASRTFCVCNRREINLYTKKKNVPHGLNRTDMRFLMHLFIEMQHVIC